MSVSSPDTCTSNTRSCRPATSPLASASHSQRFIYNSSADSSVCRSFHLHGTAQHTILLHPGIPPYIIDIPAAPLYTCTRAHVHLQASSPASTCPLPELCRVRTRRASHGQLPNHASTGSQSSTLKSTRSTFQSPDRLWVLSPTDSPLHLASMLHFSRV